MGFLQILWSMLNGSSIPKIMAFLAFDNPWWQTELFDSELMTLMAIGNEVSAFPKVVPSAFWLFALRRSFLFLFLIFLPNILTSLSQVRFFWKDLWEQYSPSSCMFINKNLFTLFYTRKSVLLDVKSVINIFFPCIS